MTETRASETQVSELPTKLPPPKTEQQKQMARAALDALLEKAGGNKYELSRQMGVSRNTISWWFTKGYVGRNAVKQLVRDKGLDPADLRPDLL